MTPTSRWAAVVAAATLTLLALGLLLPGAPATANGALAPVIHKQRRPGVAASSPLAASAAVTAGSITGNVVAGGASAAGVRIVLREYSGDIDRAVLTTTTTITGFFSFANPPTPPGDFTYYAYYGQNTTNPAYVFEWYGRDIVGYTEGGAGDAGTLDITNAPLLSPPPFAVGLFPVTFKWQTGSIPNHAYYVDLVDPATGKIIGQGFSAGSGSEATFVQPSDVPSLVLTKTYLWIVSIYDSNVRSSYGRSFEARPISFATDSLYLPLLSRNHTPGATP